MTEEYFERLHKFRTTLAFSSHNYGCGQRHLSIMHAALW